MALTTSGSKQFGVFIMVHLLAHYLYLILLIDWLIDWLLFCTLSVMFQPYINEWLLHYDAFFTDQVIELFLF